MSGINDFISQINAAIINPLNTTKKKLKHFLNEIDVKIIEISHNSLSGPSAQSQLIELKARVTALFQSTCTETVADQNPHKKARLDALKRYLALDWKAGIPQPESDKSLDWHSLPIDVQIAAASIFLNLHKKSTSRKTLEQVVDRIWSVFDQIGDDLLKLRAEEAAQSLPSTPNTSQRKESLTFRFGEPQTEIQEKKISPTLKQLLMRDCTYFNARLAGFSESSQKVIDFPDVSFDKFDTLTSLLYFKPPATFKQAGEMCPLFDFFGVVQLSCFEL